MVSDPLAPKRSAKLLAFCEANAILLAAVLMVAISTIMGMTASA